MKISAKGVYAVEIMLDVLEYGKHGPVVIKEVAARRSISGKYAEQVVSTLNFAGLVKSARGPKGGYQATEKAKTATVGTILKLTESTLKEQNQELTSNHFGYVIRDLNAAIDQVFEKYTLKQLLELKQETGNEYII